MLMTAGRLCSKYNQATGMFILLNTKQCGWNLGQQAKFSITVRSLNYTAHADLGHPRRLAAPCHSLTGNVPLVQYDTIDYINMHPKADE